MNGVPTRMAVLVGKRSAEGSGANGTNVLAEILGCERKAVAGYHL